MRRLLIGSAILNIVLIAAIIGGLQWIVNFAKSYSRIPAERWRTQFEFLTERRNGIVFLGDSITEGGRWSEMFNNSAVQNRGIGGDTTQNVIDRIEQIYALQPAKLFLMIGVNDLNQHGKVDEVLANYRELFDGFSVHMPDTEVYVQSVLPVSDHWMVAADNADIEQLNAFLKSESERRGYNWIDLNSEFRDADGKLRKELSNDGIHLLGPGYLLWRDLIRTRVAE